MEHAEARPRTLAPSRRRRSDCIPAAAPAVVVCSPGMHTNPFPKTKWTLVSRAGKGGDPKAFRELYEAYWFPVYAFVRRRSGSSSADDVGDLTQGFFAHLLEKGGLEKADRNHGSKFRSWLLGCVAHYLANKRDYEHIPKRYPGRPIESLDAIAAEGRYWAEPTTQLTPEQLYEREFTLDLLARVLELLRIKEGRKGNEAQFDALKGCLSNDTELRPHKEIAADLGKTEEAVRKAAHDLRRRFGKLLRTEVASLLTDPDEDAINEELRQLLAALEQ